MNFVSIDFETANYERTSACSIGIVIVQNGEITHTEHHLIRPYPDYYLSQNTQIHGLTSNDTVDAPSFEELWPRIAKYFQNTLVVAHNASFDISVLRATLSHYNIGYPIFNYYCTLRLAKFAIPSLANHKLPTVCKAVEAKHMLKHHDALSDAIGCAEILTHLILNKGSYGLDKGCVEAGKVFPTNYFPFKIVDKRRAPKVGKTKRVGATLKINVAGGEENAFCNERVAITGELSFSTKDDAYALIEQCGGTAARSMSFLVRYTVVGASSSHATNKLLKVREGMDKGKDMYLLTEQEFVDMLRGAAHSPSYVVDDLEARKRMDIFTQELAK